MEIVSNIHHKKFGLNVRRDGPQPSIFVRSFSPITNSSTRLVVVRSLGHKESVSGSSRNSSLIVSSIEMGVEMIRACKRSRRTKHKRGDATGEGTEHMVGSYFDDKIPNGEVIPV